MHILFEKGRRFAMNSFIEVNPGVISGKCFVIEILSELRGVSMLFLSIMKFQ